MIFLALLSISPALAIIATLLQNIAILVPIMVAVVGGWFAYQGNVLNNKAKEKDQEYEGVKTGQLFLKDALNESRVQIAELKNEISELKTLNTRLATENERQLKTNQRLMIQASAHERKIRFLEGEVERLKKDGADGI